MQIHVTRKEMENAYRNHKLVWESGKDIPNNSLKMILFYAVECGLKAYFMQKFNLERTDRTNQDNISPSNYIHRVDSLCSKLDIKMKTHRVKNNGEKPIEFWDLHQAWRYGKQLDNNEENRCINEFQKILDELNEKLK